MRIDPNAMLNANLEPARPNRNSSAVSGTGAVTNATDSASLSVDHGRVQALEAEVMHYPEIRNEKVKALQQSIAAGSFRVDAPKIADALMAESFR